MLRFSFFDIDKIETFYKTFYIMNKITIAYDMCYIHRDKFETKTSMILILFFEMKNNK